MNAEREKKLPDGITIRDYMKPGDVGYITYLHGTLYAREQNWDHTFDAYVAAPLAEFAKTKNERQHIWIVEKTDVIIGCVAIVEAGPHTAQLRWLLLHPDWRGRGIGRLLLGKALSFCREKGYAIVCLWTVNKLLTAVHLYKSFGFQLLEEKTRELWGATVTEHRYELPLS